LILEMHARAGRRGCSALWQERRPAATPSAAFRRHDWAAADILSPVSAHLSRCPGARRGACGNLAFSQAGTFRTQKEDR
jgi:hypothetical protein